MIEISMSLYSAGEYLLMIEFTIFSSLVLWYLPSVHAESMIKSYNSEFRRIMISDDQNISKHRTHDFWIFLICFWCLSQIFKLLSSPEVLELLVRLRPQLSWVENGCHFVSELEQTSVTLGEKPPDVGMDQYLLIPFLGGWTSIYQLFWCSPGVQGFDTLPCWKPPKAAPLWRHGPWQAACAVGSIAIVGASKRATWQDRAASFGAWSPSGLTEHSEMWYHVHWFAWYIIVFNPQR